MKLLERMREVGMRRRLSRATIRCYQSWILGFCRVEGQWVHPGKLEAREVERFLTDLARRRRVSASTQNQALCALVFLYKQVLVDEVGERHLEQFEAERARRRERVPTVLSTAEVARLIEAMEARSMRRLMVELLYGTGMRVMECCTLRVRDMDFDRKQIVIRGGKGDKDRVVMLPGRCVKALAEQVRRARALHDRDLRRGGGYVPVAVRWR